MFTKDMIAPCGLDCSLCAAASDPYQPCGGCMGPDERMPEYCRTMCEIKNCAVRRANDYRFCDACADYPCEPLRTLEIKYHTEYPLKESPEGNLRDIREHGMDAFLADEKSQWGCNACGGAISVHVGHCVRCEHNAKRG